MNVLGQCNVLHRPIGQLIVAAAIVDDILALVILSQLRALTGEGESTDTSRVIIPIVSAFVWLGLGSYIALAVFPSLFQKVLQQLVPNYTKNQTSRRSMVSLVCLLAILFGLLAATFYSKASYLLGAFLTGLAFCQSEIGLKELFRNHLETLIEWLMRIFFAATIGFQVPIRSFSSWTVISRGLFFVLALTGKLAIGLLTPKFDAPTRYRGRHLRDCFVVGFSMTGEAEFAFVVAVFGVTEGLIPPDTYASVVLAVLLSTILSPLLLRMTLALFSYEDDREGDGDKEHETSDAGAVEKGEE